MIGCVFVCDYRSRILCVLCMDVCACLIGHVCRLCCMCRVLPESSRTCRSIRPWRTRLGQVSRTGGLIHQLINSIFRFVSREIQAVPLQKDGDDNKYGYLYFLEQVNLAEIQMDETSELHRNSTKKF
ncbi:hypothetical protein LXL04_028809 [Taraxacum kok-saghyz]